jgi:sulfite oxidase
MPITSAITRTRLKTRTATTTSDNGAAKGQDGQTSDGSQNVVELEGYAYSGGGREIQRVDVSLDGGKTWDQARLLDDRKHELGSKAWCWKRWKYEGKLPDTTTAADVEVNNNHPNTNSPAPQNGERRTTLIVKATDDAYNTQPETHKSIYNLRGNLATAWHRVDFDCGGNKDCEEEQKKKLAGSGGIPKGGP